MEHVKYILKQSWSRHSSSKWTEECPSCGQCGVTALVIKTISAARFSKQKSVRAGIFTTASMV